MLSQLLSEGSLIGTAMTDFVKKNWLLIIGICIVIFIIYAFSLKAGAIVAAVLSFLGAGGKGAKRKVEKRAEKKAKAIRDRGPDAVTDDINKRISRR